MGGMNDIALQLALLCQTTGYVPKWGGLRDREESPVSFDFRPPTDAEYNAWLGRDGESDTDGATRDRTYFEAIITGGTFNGERLTAAKAVDALLAVRLMAAEVGMAAFSSQSVQIAPSVSDLIKGAELQEKEQKGSGIAYLANRLHVALGGKVTEGNG